MERSAAWIDGGTRSTTSTAGPATDRRARILVVAARGTLERRFLVETLRLAGHVVGEVDDGEHAVQAVGGSPAPDVVIAEATAVRDGATVADFVLRLRRHSDVPLIVVTRAVDEDEELLCLHAGADAYLARALTASRLHAHLAVQLRRRPSSGGLLDVLTVGDLRIDVQRREVLVGEAVLALTRTEFDVLVGLAVTAGSVVERERLAAVVWGAEVQSDHPLDVQLSRLRGKLRDAGSTVTVTTVRGVGFRLDP
jgi:DNA-binding response OmpR family regulator